MKSIIVLLCLITAGCASSTRPARDYAEKGLTVSAYTQLTTELHNNRKGDRPYASALVAEFPDLQTYGSGLFTEAALTEWTATHNDMHWIQYRLTTFCATNSPEDCDAAIQRVKDAEKKIKPPKPWFSTTKELVEQLSPTEKLALDEKYNLTLYSTSNLGVVTDRQVANLSTPGSAAGSVAGAAVGSAAYNVNSVSSNNPKNWSYSPWADLGSALLGAVVGSAANRAPVARYRFQYTVKLLDGNTADVQEEIESPIGHGIGVCIYVKGPTKVDDTVCNMTVQQLREKL